MLKRDEFVRFILDGPSAKTKRVPDPDTGPSLPEGFKEFAFTATETRTARPSKETSFARRLMEASGFGSAQFLERAEVILADDTVERYLPDKVYYWPKTGNRPYQTLLFELEKPGGELLKTALFRQLKGQEILEDALSRLVQMSLVDFGKGGERRTAAIKRGRQEETLCIVSIHDDRVDVDEPVHLICLGTQSADQGSLETFHIREEARVWERQLAEDHLGRLYDRHFSKLVSERWQNAFITGEERKLARELMSVCTEARPSRNKIEDKITALLEEIARGFGLKRKKGGPRLSDFQLPDDHDIGIDAETRDKRGGLNPFQGLALRDEGNRLLGYIIYCLDEKKDAAELRKHLERYNRFHNVLVIYPDGERAMLELWQGTKKLEGKLTKRGAIFEGEGKIVNLLSRFFVVSKAKVRNPTELAEELAYRARYLRRLALRQLREERDAGHLRDLYGAFKKALIHDQTEEQFADAYAQTLTYGLLSARWISKDHFVAKRERFTREKASEYLSNASPFLKEFFSKVLSTSFEFKLTWLLEDIADLLDRTDINSVFAAQNSSSEFNADPVIHFYEPFLAAYDPKIKKARGVFYTPLPVVSFIVRRVDEILQTEFGLSDGLADTATWADMARRHPELAIPEDLTGDEPFVQVLDPATGTGTFLVKVIEIIYSTMTTKWKKQGCSGPQIVHLWNDYVPNHLLPRIFGFELMMAPYAIAHMKIGLKLIETGYKLGSDRRIHVFLTNSLEPPEDFSDRLAFDIPALSQEANAANEIKHRLPTTVIIGNPPYSGISSNMNPWIDGLLKGNLPSGVKVSNYYEVEGKPVGEKKIWLQDDYVKFVRFAHWQLDKAGVGILGYITNSSYLDGPTYRGMRYQLLTGFTQLFVLNLHGSVKRHQDHALAATDENVFDIQQGVCIGLFTKSGTISAVVKATYAELWGSRKEKYNALSEENMEVGEVEIQPDTPWYFLVPRDASETSEYQTWPSVQDLFLIKSTSVQTSRDAFVVDFDRTVLEARIKLLADHSIADKVFREEYKLRDGRNWNLEKARADISSTEDWANSIQSFLYRAFDYRFVCYRDSLINWPQHKVMDHLRYPNVALLVPRQLAGQEYHHVMCTRILCEMCVVSTATKEQVQAHPLYLYEDASVESLKPAQKTLDGTTKVPNFNPDVVRRIESALGMTMKNVDTGNLSDHFGPEDFFHYVYAILHSPKYRERYAEFLNMDFPRIPLTGNCDLFASIVSRGADLVALHLLEDSYDSASWRKAGGESQNPFTASTVTIGGDAAPYVESGYPKYKAGKVYINKLLWFEYVPEEVWNFNIGGYQVCHKWLKDRQAKGGKNPRPARLLTDEDIAHYQKIVAAISETIRLMQEIDKVIEKHGGWPGAFLAE